jgi:hypothetical protein
MRMVRNVPAWFTLAFVPQPIPCPKCDKTGFIRLENIIKGDLVSVEYYCGACNNSWIVAAPTPLPPKPTPLSKPRTRTFDPKPRSS